MIVKQTRAVLLTSLFVQKETSNIVPSFKEVVCLCIKTNWQDAASTPNKWTSRGRGNQSIRYLHVTDKPIPRDHTRGKYTESDAKPFPSDSV